MGAELISSSAMGTDLNSCFSAYFRSASRLELELLFFPAAARPAERPAEGSSGVGCSSSWTASSRFCLTNLPSLSRFLWRVRPALNLVPLLSGRFCDPDLFRDPDRSSPASPSILELESPSPDSPSVQLRPELSS